MHEPLVFLPGFMCDARLFAPQIAALGHAHVVTVAPISGFDRIEDVAADLLPKLPQKFALVGHSLGGNVALEMIRRAPERVSRLVLMGTQAMAETPQSSASYEPLLIGAKTGRYQDVLRGFMKPEYLATGPGRVAVLNQFLTMATDLGPEIFQQQIRLLQRRSDQQSILRRLRCPVLVIGGGEDHLVPVKRHQFMADLIPYAQLSIVEQAGHLPSLERPESVTEALRNWLEQPFVLRA